MSAKAGRKLTTFVAAKKFVPDFQQKLAKERRKSAINAEEIKLNSFFAIKGNSSPYFVLFLSKISGFHFTKAAVPNSRRRTNVLTLTTFKQSLARFRFFTLFF